MRNRTLTIGAAALVALASLTACGSGSSDKVSANCKPAHKFSTIKKGTLTVAGYDLPPYSKFDGDDITGVDGDIVKAIAKKECLTITPKSLATAAVIPTVQGGRADVAIANWYRTAERAKIVNLSEPMYTDQMALISDDGISDIADLKDKKVGTVDGYLWVDDLKKYLGGSLKIYPSTLNMNQDLKAGRISVGVDSYGSAVYNNKNLKIEVAKPNASVAASQEPAQSALVSNKKNPEMLKAFNADIAVIRDDGDMVSFLKKNGLPKSAADTGKPRLIGG